MWPLFCELALRGGGPSGKSWGAAGVMSGPVSRRDRRAMRAAGGGSLLDPPGGGAGRPRGLPAGPAGPAGLQRVARTPAHPLRRCPSTGGAERPEGAVEAGGPCERGRALSGAGPSGGGGWTAVCGGLAGWAAPGGRRERDRSVAGRVCVLYDQKQCRACVRVHVWAWTRALPLLGGCQGGRL